MWFRAKLQFRAVHVNASDAGAAVVGALKETEVFIMVDNPDESQRAAEDVGRREEQYGVAPSGGTIRWSFVKVLELGPWPTAGFPDGARLFGRLTDEVPPLETIRHIGGGYFYDTPGPEEGAEIAHLRTLFHNDAEWADMARRDFDLALSGRLSDEEVLSIVKDSFNRAVRSREAAELYLRSLRDALFGPESD